METLGERIQLTLFGESHGAGVGALITGMIPGVAIDEEAIAREMARRSPGNKFATSRRERDRVEFLSGVYRGYTTGSPLALWIKNGDARSEDYENIPFRPGHADYPYHVKYGGYDDPRGGGHASGRLTAPLVAAGSIAKSLLAGRGITVESAVEEVGGFRERAEILSALEEAKSAGDSLGGIVALKIAGVPTGLGGPRFHSLQGKLAHALYGVGAVKSVAFGAGEDAARAKGSENNDPYILEGGEIRAAKNDAGGVLGGVATGEDIAIRVAVKPTPSIGKSQKSVDRKGREVNFALGGRHDVAVVLRIPVALEAAAAFALLDALVAFEDERAFLERVSDREKR